MIAGIGLDIIELERIAKVGRQIGKVPCPNTNYGRNENL